MVDPEKQAAFFSALRKGVEDAAAKNIVLSEMRTVSKAAVNEMRTRLKQGESTTPMGAYMGTEGNIEFVRSEAQDPSLAGEEILHRLRNQAMDRKIRAVALCHVVDKQATHQTMGKLIDVHMEHATGKAYRGVVPADESAYLQGVPGVEGPAISLSGGPTQPKVFRSDG